MENFCSHTDCFAFCLSTNRSNHKFLEGNRSIRVSTSVDNVHHWNWEHVSICTTNIAVERNIESLCCSLSCCKRNTKNSICTKFALCRSSIECEHFHIYSALFKNVKALQSWCDNFVYIIDCLKNAFSTVASFVTVTKFKSFIFTSAGSRRNCGTSEHTVFKNYIYFNSRISA